MGFEARQNDLTLRNLYTEVTHITEMDLPFFFFFFPLVKLLLKLKDVE